MNYPQLENIKIVVKSCGSRSFMFQINANSFHSHLLLDLQIC